MKVSQTLDTISNPNVEENKVIIHCVATIEISTRSRSRCLKSFGMNFWTRRSIEEERVRDQGAVVDPSTAYRPFPKLTCDVEAFVDTSHVFRIHHAQVVWLLCERSEHVSGANFEVMSVVASLIKPRHD